MSAWLEDADPREATSNTGQDRDMDLAIDSTLPPTSTTLHIRNNLFQEMPDDPQTSSNIVGSYSFRSRPKLPKSSGTSRLIQSDLYSEATGFKRPRGRPLGSFRRSKNAAGRSFIMRKKRIGEVPLSLNKPMYVYKKKLPLGQPRKDSNGSPLGLSPVPRRLQLNPEIGPGVVPLSKMKSNCAKKEKKRRGRPRKENVKSTSDNKIKRPVGRPRKETIGSPPESGPGHIPILQKLLLNAETGLEVVPLSQENSNSANKIKGTLWRPPRTSIGKFPRPDSDNTADLEMLKEVVPGQVSLSPVPSLSAENMKRSIERPMIKTLRSPAGSVSDLSPVPPRMQLSSDLEPGKVYLLKTNSTSANKMKSPLGRPPRTSVGLLHWSLPDNTPRSEMLKDEVVPGEVSFPPVKSLSTNKIKRPVGRPRKEKVASDIKIKRPVGRPRKETVSSSPVSGYSPVPKRLQLTNEVESGVVSSSQVKSISAYKVKRPAGRRREDTQGLPSPSDANHIFGRPTLKTDDGLDDGPSVDEESDFLEEFERLKEVLGLTQTADTSKSPVPQRLQLNEEMEPRGVSLSKTKSIYSNKKKRPNKRPRKKIEDPRELSPRYVPVSQRRKLKAKVGKPIVSLTKVKSLPAKKIKRHVRRPRNTPLGSRPGLDPENTPTKRPQSNSEEGLGMISIVKSSVGEKTEQPVGSPRKETASSDPDLTCDRPNLITEVVSSFKKDSNILDDFNKPVRGPEEIPAQPSESGRIHSLDLGSV